MVTSLGLGVELQLRLQSGSGIWLGEGVEAVEVVKVRVGVVVRKDVGMDVEIGCGAYHEPHVMYIHGGHSTRPFTPFDIPRQALLAWCMVCHKQEDHRSFQPTHE